MDLVVSSVNFNVCVDLCSYHCDQRGAVTPKTPSCHFSSSSWQPLLGSPSPPCCLCVHAVYVESFGLCSFEANFVHAADHL